MHEDRLNYNVFIGLNHIYPLHLIETKMQNIIHKDVIDVGDTVYLLFQKSLHVGRKKEVIYDTHDALKVLSFFDHVSGDDEDPIVTPCCKVEDVNGNVFDEELEVLSLNPDDKAKRRKYLGIRILRIGAIVAVVAGFIIWAVYR